MRLGTGCLDPNSRSLSQYTVSTETASFVSLLVANSISARRPSSRNGLPQPRRCSLAAAEKMQPTTILVDFAHLKFMDSTGLKTLLEAHRLATGSGRAFVVLNGREGVRRIFELTRTEHLFDSRMTPAILDPSPSEADGDWSPITMPGADGG